MTFPSAKIELHQWANTGLLTIVGFFVVQTFLTIKEDHEKIAQHETRITVAENNIKRSDLDLHNLVGRVDQIRKLKNRELGLSEAD